MFSSAIVGGLVVAAVGTAVPPVIDGDFTDWPAAVVTVKDAQGDAAQRFDLLSCQAVATNGRLYLAIDTATPLNLIAGHGSDGTLVITVDCAATGERVRIDTRSRSVTGTGGKQLVWDEIAYRAMPTVASTSYELSLSLAALGANVGDELTVTFGGSDSFPKPLALTVEHGPNVVRVPGDTRRAEGADLRIASINTLRTGTQHAQRGPVLAGIIDGLDPDVVCFQEEWDASESEVASWLEAADPREDGAGWLVHKSNGNIIAVPDSYGFLPFDAGERFFAGAVLVDGDRSVAVVSLHLKCCGYAGSNEDLRRIEQAEILRDVLLAFRGGALGKELIEHADAPIVLVGDWNLVGSGGALRTILETKELGMADAMPVSLAGDDFSTWRDLTPDPGGFPAGRLDLLVHSADHAPLRTFLFDSADLSEAEQARISVGEEASLASDHLLIVADFAHDAP